MFHITHSAQLQLAGVEFQNLVDTSTIPGSVLATYSCFTQNSPPTTLSWTKNGVPLTIDNIHYRTIQVVTNRLTSSYKNILLVYDITALLGNPTFTCNIRTNDGQHVSGDIQEGLTGGLPSYTLSITPLT